MSNTQKNTSSRPVFTRVSPELAERLERDAAAADRTMAGQVRHLIKKGLEAQEASAA